MNRDSNRCEGHVNRGHEKRFPSPVVTYATLTAAVDGALLHARYPPHSSQIEALDFTVDVGAGLC
ncbi:hypothetical protein GCM10018775_88940 [Streptomyces umbrinus]|nr:hypothetical protein GCM10018775_88940 [Streptomyces umbrinus]